MKGRRVDKNSNYKQKGSYRGTTVGVHPVHIGICCADFSEPIPVRALFYIMKVHAQREQSAGHLVSSYAMGGQEALHSAFLSHVVLLYRLHQTQTDRQGLPRCALALAAMFSPSALHFKRRVNREISFSVSHRWLCSPEVARGEPENSSSYSISTRLSQPLLAGRDVIPRERIWTIVPPLRGHDLRNKNYHRASSKKKKKKKKRNIRTISIWMDDSTIRGAISYPKMILKWKAVAFLKDSLLTVVIDCVEKTFN